MEILDLRHFSSGDLRPLLERETELWSSLLSWDYLGSAQMILRYIDARILPGYAAVERGVVWGYSFFVYEGSKGVIGDLFVLPDNGNRPNGNSPHQVEVRLLRHVIDTLQQSPGVHRVEAQLLVHEAGAVAAPFMDQGFRRYPRLYMTLPLTPGGGEKPRVEESFEIRPWADQDYQQSASLITACYRGHIDSEINDQYRTVGGSLRFLNNIIRFPGCGVFDPHSSFVAFSKTTRSLVGLILCSRISPPVGHVTQVCVLPEFRGHRIGQVLLAATADDLRRRGFSLLSLTVTAANAGAVELYKRLGYGVQRVFDAYVWEG